MSETLRDHRHNRGIISTLLDSSPEGVEEFVMSYAEKGRDTPYIPPLRGKAAVEASGRPLEDFGPILHLNKTDDGQDKEIDWDQGIILLQINRAISYIPYGDGFLAIMNASFDCALKAKQPAGA
ncbi:MAG TPA: hypothetical protein VLE93_00520 [Candidatus Saccharimonadales bacterium]|nr:hypothetical protein [Candidatus Saccharimonadales bacterium]